MADVITLAIAIPSGSCSVSAASHGCSIEIDLMPSMRKPGRTAGLGTGSVVGSEMDEHEFTTAGRQSMRFSL
jgi:hypothetical protein